MPRANKITSIIGGKQQIETKSWHKYCYIRHYSEERPCEAESRSRIFGNRGRDRKWADHLREGFVRSKSDDFTRFIPEKIGGVIRNHTIRMIYFRNRSRYVHIIGSKKCYFQKLKFCSHFVYDVWNNDYADDTIFIIRIVHSQHDMKWCADLYCWELFGSESHN